VILAERSLDKADKQTRVVIGAFLLADPKGDDQDKIIRFGSYAYGKPHRARSMRRRLSDSSSRLVMAGRRPKPRNSMA